MNTRCAYLWSVIALLSFAAPTARGDEQRSADPDLAQGEQQRNGYTHFKFLTRAVKDGKELDVPYEADVWLPPGYETEPDRRYPVIYVLQNMDIPRGELAEMSRKGQFPPFIVVHIGGITQPLNRGEEGVWTDSQGPAGTIFRKQFIGWVEKHFRCASGPKGRVLVGCSKAGGAVMHLGLNYPELFAAIVSADGAMGLYDTGRSEDDGYYEKNKLRLLDAIERHRDAAKTLPALMLLGSMFGFAGENDAYLNRLKTAGMRALDFQDCRHHGHNCDSMTAEFFPEVMATFYNGIGDFAPWQPSLSHGAGVYAAPIDVTFQIAERGWTIRCTLDGSDPHKAGQQTNDPIRVDKSCWLRAIGVSPDGKQQSRETLARFTIQAPLSATPAGTQPGLALRGYEGVALDHLADFFVRLQKGESPPVVESTVTTLGLTKALLDQAGGKNLGWLYTGTLTVPETKVYEFEIDWSGGLYFPLPGKPLGAIGHGAYPVAAFSVALEKGAHQILLVQGGGKVTKDGNIPMQLQVRKPDGRFQPVPADWYR